MLHIKLPKGKVAKACERAAEECSKRITVWNHQYTSHLERWEEEARAHPFGVHEYEPPQRPRQIHLLSSDRNELYKMADMCRHSTGDVYVSPELWTKIKGYY